MTQKDMHITRQTLRQRAQVIVDALKAAPVPETYAEIIRAARAVMAIDKMLKQLWPDDETHENAAQHIRSENTPAVASQPLNRQQRRAQEAKQRTGRTPPLLGRGG